MKIHGTTLIADLQTRKTMLTTTEVIDMLRTTRHTLCGWVRTGKIPAVRTSGNGYLFDPQVLAAWIEERSSYQRQLPLVVK